jgi:hypothetical protein
MSQINENSIKSAVGAVSPLRSPPFARPAGHARRAAGPRTPAAFPPANRPVNGTSRFALSQNLAIVQPNKNPHRYQGLPALKKSR